MNLQGWDIKHGLPEVEKVCVMEIIQEFYSCLGFALIKKCGRINRFKISEETHLQYI